jgi:crotonobetainyl-CoA:carnitine CoA-transferase CaiB-like acyl-CoA transferase
MSETMAMDAERTAGEARPTLPLDEVKALIAQHFPTARGSMHIRSLWSRNGVHYFRVNWWRELPYDASYIGESAFVAVEEMADGSLQIRESNRRSAA